MSIANLVNIPTLEDGRSFDLFSFSNMDQHRLATEAILAQKNISLDLFVLDPIPPFAFQDWLRRHQASHNAINGVLGVDGVDLTAVSFEDQAQAADWISLHQSEHRQWADILRLT